MDFIVDNLLKLTIVLVTVVAFVVRTEFGMRRNKDAIEELHRELEKMSRISSKQREHMEHQIMEMRGEMNQNFQAVNTTLKEIMFRMNDRSNGR